MFLESDYIQRWIGQESKEEVGGREEGCLTHDIVVMSLPTISWVRAKTIKKCNQGTRVTFLCLLSFACGNQF